MERTYFPAKAAGIVILAALVWGILIFALLPRGIVVLNDDFGYLKSVVETIQHHRPWTDDWLEPWSASLSSLSASLFLATHSFYSATSGLQAVLATVSCWTLCFLLKWRGLPATAAAAVAIAVLSFPTFLWKTLEYTGMILYLPCFLLAILAAESRRWGLFFLVFAAALANRQSALTWLVLPAYAFLRAVIVAVEQRDRKWLGPAAVLIGGGTWFFVLVLTMNRTHAREIMTGDMLDRLNALTALKHFSAGGLFFFLAAGLGAFFLQLFSPNQAFSCRSRRGPAFWMILMIAVLALVVDERSLALREYALLDGRLGWLYIKLLVIISVTIWLSLQFRLRLEFAVGAVGSLVLVCIRPDVYDYYLSEVVLFGFLAVDSAPAEGETPNHNHPIRWRTFALRAAIAAVAVFQLLFLFQFKLTLDRAWAVDSVYEHALRTDRRSPTELSGAPFGYLGWHLFPYYAAHEGETSTRLWGFIDYATNSAQLRSRYDGWLTTSSLLPHEQSPNDRLAVLADEVHRIGWFFHGRFVLQRIALTAEGKSIRGESNFPLNDAEWIQLIDHDQFQLKPPPARGPIIVIGNGLEMHAP